MPSKTTIQSRRRSILALAATLACALTTSAQDPTVAFPNNYRLILDNPSVAVLRVHYGPHETIGVHDHSGVATVYVYLNDSGPVRFIHDEAHPFEIARPPTHAGAFRVSPGRIERHSIQNLSDTPSDYLRVELKRIPIKTLPNEFRGPAPHAPLHTGTAAVYDNPRLHIDRIVCAPHAACSVPSLHAPSLLIAISPKPVAVANSPKQLTSEDPVLWLQAGKAVSLNFSSAAPVQFLRIELPRE